MHLAMIASIVLQIILHARLRSPFFMAKQRKQKPAAQSQQSSTEEIPENEQWRIIEETGVLKRIPEEWRSKSSKVPPPDTEPQKENGDDDDPFSPLCDEVFNAICFTIPFSSLYIMMDLLAHRQYAQEITATGLLEKVFWGIPFLYTFIFYTLRYKQEWQTQVIIFLLSVGCGCRLIYIVNWASWRTVINQCASLGTIWVYSIVHLNLLPAVGALAIVAAYVKWKDLRIIF
ncbi:hypothetical protein ACEPAG_6280 [Sanghuangporus baumii]